MVTNEVTAATFYPRYLGYLRAHGWKVSLIASSNGALGDLGRRVGVVAHDLQMRRDPAPLHDLGSLIRAVVLLAKLRPEVVVAATPKASLLGMIAAWITRVPVRIYFMWGLRLETETGFRRGIFTLLEKLTAMLATQVLANSASLAEEAQKLNISANIIVVGAGSSHGVNVEFYDPSRTDLPKLPEWISNGLNHNPNAITVGYVGRLHRDKGIDNLLEAASQYSGSGRHINLLVVGENEDEALEERLASATGPNLAVIRVPAVHDTRPYFLAMDVHCLPTLREGFPNVVLEAAALCIPTITTKATGARDSVIPGVTGLLVEPGNPEQLAEAIAKLADSPVERTSMGASARRHVIERFTDSEIFRLQERNLDAQLNGFRREGVSCASRD